MNFIIYVYPTSSFTDNQGFDSNAYYSFIIWTQTKSLTHQKLHYVKGCKVTFLFDSCDFVDMNTFRMNKIKDTCHHCDIFRKKKKQQISQIEM